MLRLIVLGEIPGTHINLTLLQVLLLLGGFYGLVLWHHDQRLTRRAVQKRPEDIAL